MGAAGRTVQSEPFLPTINCEVVTEPRGIPAAGLRGHARAALASTIAAMASCSRDRASLRSAPACLGIAAAQTVVLSRPPGAQGTQGAKGFVGQIKEPRLPGAALVHACWGSDISCALPPCTGGGYDPLIREVD